MQQDRERLAHADLLRDIFGPDPSGPPAVDPAWRTPCVIALARAAYEDRRLPDGTLDPARLGVLGDALEEIRADAGIVAHLRSPGPHVRGCHVIDWLTGDPEWRGPATTPGC